jgi:hypothetical protein
MFDYRFEELPLRALGPVHCAATSGNCDKPHVLALIDGMASIAVAGDDWAIDGIWVNDPKNGGSFKVERKNPLYQAITDSLCEAHADSITERLIEWMQEADEEAAIRRRELAW